LQKEYKVTRTDIVAASDPRSDSQLVLVCYRGRDTSTTSTRKIL